MRECVLLAHAPHCVKLEVRGFFFFVTLKVKPNLMQLYKSNISQPISYWYPLHKLHQTFFGQTSRLLYFAVFKVDLGPAENQTVIQDRNLSSTPLTGKKWLESNKSWRTNCWGVSELWLRCVCSGREQWACVTMAKWSAFILCNLFNRFGFCLLGIVNKHSHYQLSVTR